MHDRGLTRYRRDRVGFSLQFSHRVPRLTAHAHVPPVTDVSPNPTPAEAATAPGGLADLMEHFPSEMPSGEQQRVAIARAIAKRPEILLCDEPTGALDSSTGTQVLEVLQDINDRFNTTTVIITHNAEIQRMAHRVIQFQDGKISSVSTNDECLAPAEIVW